MKVLVHLLLLMLGMVEMVRNALIAELSSEALVNLINNGSHSWTAKHNHISAMENRTQLLGARRLSVREESLLRLPELTLGVAAVVLPTSYDVRTIYPKCQDVWAIKDQSYCGSCWAVSVASAATDRLCIISGGSLQANLSSQELLSCCSYCGEGCGGGYPSYAWYYITRTGLVTGGDYGSKEGCKPYEVAPCGSSGQSSCPSSYPTFTCTGSVCTNKAYTKTYAQDKHYGSTAYLVKSAAQSIQTEIMQKGPVVATMDVYSDFYYYKSGVYKHVSGSYLGGHAVKLLGWGTLSGVDYWIAANSWGRSWGENGFFKIKRGTNECLIEQQVSAGDILNK